MGICSNDFIFPQQTNCVRFSLFLVLRREGVNWTPPSLSLATQPSADQTEASPVSRVLAAAALSQLTWSRFLSGQQAADTPALRVDYDNRLFFLLWPSTVTWPRQHPGASPRRPRLERRSTWRWRSGGLPWRQRCSPARRSRALKMCISSLTVKFIVLCLKYVHSHNAAVA